MGATCGQCSGGCKVKSNSSFIGEKRALSALGTDTVGVTEKFQYHQKYLEKKRIKLNFSDAFFREAFGPMHLIDCIEMNKILDDFLEWYQFEYSESRVWSNETDLDVIDLELVPLEAFTSFM